MNVVPCRHLRQNANKRRRESICRTACVYVCVHFFIWKIKVLFYTMALVNVKMCPDPFQISCTLLVKHVFTMLLAYGQYVHRICLANSLNVLSILLKYSNSWHIFSMCLAYVQDSTTYILKSIST